MQRSFEPAGLKNYERETRKILVIFLKTDCLLPKKHLKRCAVIAIYLIGTDLKLGMHFAKQYLMEAMLGWLSGT
jgi:hypothetical protein